MSNEINPQQVLFQTIKSLVLKSNNLVRELSEQHSDLKRRFENRSKKINEYVVSNETWRKEIASDLDNIRDSINQLRTDISKINDHFKEREMQQNILKRLFGYAKKIPGIIVALATAVCAVLSYVFNNYTP